MQLNTDEITEYSTKYELKPETILKWHRLYTKYCTSTAKSNLNAHVQKMKDFEEFIVWSLKRSKKQREGHQIAKSLNLKDVRAVTEAEELRIYEAALKGIEENESFVPSSETFYKFAILFAAIPIDKLRAEVFGWVRPDVWNKFVKMFFSFYHANPEQVAMDLRTIRERSSQSLKKQIKTLEDLQAKETNPDKIIDFAKTIGQLTNQLSSISSQFAKDLSSLNLVGSRIKGGVNIQIINKIPRPVNHGFKNSEIKTIEAEARVLDE